MTIEEQSELRKILVALDGLIKQFVPEDDLVRLAMDPKRQQAAARMVGTATLAGDLLHRAYELCESMPHPSKGYTPNGRPKGNSKIDQWIREHLPSTLVQKSEYVNKLVKAGYNRSNVYFAIQRLLADGTLKQTSGSKGGQKRELFT